MFNLVFLVLFLSSKFLRDLFLKYFIMKFVIFFLLLNFVFFVMRKSGFGIKLV